MKAREIIKNLMKEQNVQCSKVARALGTTSQNLYNKLHMSYGNDLKLDTLIGIANYLDYDVMLVPKTRSDLVGGTVLTNDDQ